MNQPKAALSTPFRLRAKLGQGEKCFPEASDVLMRFLTSACKRFQVELEPVTPAECTTFRCESVGIQVLVKRSELGFYFEMSTFLSQSTLSGRQRATVFLSSVGLLDLQLETSNDISEQLSGGAIPEFLANLATNSGIGLLEYGTNVAFLGQPLAIGSDADALFDFVCAKDRSVCVIVFGAESSITADTLGSLARRITGAAHVTVLESTKATSRFLELTGPGWDIPRDCARIFSPAVDFAGEPLRTSRLVTAGPDIAGEENDADPWNIDKTWEMLSIASRFTGVFFSDIPMISLENATAALSSRTSVIDPTLPDDVHDRPDSGPRDHSRIVELQSTIDELRQSLAILADEKAFESELAQSWKRTAEKFRNELERFQTATDYSEALSKVSSNWRALIESILLEAVVASEQVETAEDLRESLAVVTAQNRSLVFRGSQLITAEERLELLPNDPANLAIVLSQRYPGRFALLGQGSRSYKATSPYQDQDRFLLALDILGREYYEWKMAAESDVLPLKNCFEERCKSASFKTSPSATPQGLAVYPEEHTIRLADGVRLPMYELRDHGTTMEERHMLYIGFVWDERSCQIVLGRFSHPRVLSAHT